MRILFAIQGTGNGHLSRGAEIYPELTKYGTVDVLISGIQADVTFPFPVKYRLYGLSFIFGKAGGVDIKETLKRLKLRRLLRDISKLDIKAYDIIINDFEPVSAWACKLKNIPCISLSHQCAVLHEHAPLPKENDLKGRIILRNYAPCTSYYGFHFRAFAKNIFTPVIRKAIRERIPVDEGHYTVYLPAYEDEVLIEHLAEFDNVQWQVFSKHNARPFTYKNIQVQPIENHAFIESMVRCHGLLCGAGFEGPAEALFLGKKVLAIPMQGQYEQQCNAAGLAQLGVPIIKYLGRKYHDRIRWWIMAGKPVEVNYQDQTATIIEQIMQEHASKYNLTLKSALHQDGQSEFSTAH